MEGILLDVHPQGRNLALWIKTEVGVQKYLKKHDVWVVVIADDNDGCESLLKSKNYIVRRVFVRLIESNELVDAVEVCCPDLSRSEERR